MAQKTLFVRDQPYNDTDLSDMFQAIIKGGVYDEDQGLQIIVPGDGSNGMTVFVCAGRAWIKGHYFQSDTTEVYAIDAADGVLSRKDIIALEYKPNTVITIKYIKGEASSQPTAPDITQSDECYQLKLAEILVSAGITKITQPMITDYRYDSTVCGIVTGMIQQYDIAQFMAQANAEFAEWFAAVKNQLSTDAAGNLQNQINTNTYSLSGGTQIPQGADLYNYIDDGNYYCPFNNYATSLLHTPPGLATAFTMKVYKGTGVDYPMQEIKPLATSIVYKNRYDPYGKAWAGWTSNATDADMRAFEWSAGSLLGTQCGLGLSYRYCKNLVEIWLTGNTTAASITAGDGYVFSNMPVSLKPNFNIFKYLEARAGINGNCYLCQFPSTDNKWHLKYNGTGTLTANEYIDMRFIYAI